ncbi:filament-like plant protein 7 isoform X2 [Salvia divinorum]|uniref:Filament-like plant protein 7 isoform X2 n=1 Tax=Salvia divinorum TaxID=28513 RepID=A0ABD1I6Y1_SALDI
MDQKTWLWKRKSSEKTILASSDEAQTVSIEKEVDLENSLKLLNEKLASAADECSAKDELMLSYKREAQVTAADRRKAEEEIGRLKQELDEAQQQRSAANERLGHLNSTLKNCMEQLNLARQEQEQRMIDAVMQTSEEFEKSHKKLEEKLSEARKQLASLTSENTYLSKAVIVKEKMIEDLNSVKIQTQAELEALMARLDSVEKENAFLRYEFRSVEKELELKNEEMEYSRRSAESSLKQHLENVKKIKKLEMECQRLRGLIRKGPTMLARDMETQGRKQQSTRRKATCLQGHGDVYGIDLENTSKQLSFLIDQVQDLQKENTVFKEFLAKKNEEIFHLRKLKDSESHEKFEHKLLRNTVEVDEISSRALALVSECQMIGASEMSLMDDFAEMEKLAIVSVEPPCGGSFDVDSNSLALVARDNHSEMGHELIKARDTFCKKIDDDWLQNVTNMILEQHNASKRSIDELLEDIRVSSSRNIRHPEPSQPLPISGYITWKSPPSSPSPAVLIQEWSTESLQFDMNRSITKLIELIADMKSSKVEGDYEIRAFRWTRSDITAVLQEFTDSCHKLLNGKICFEKFTVDLAYILEWVVNGCVLLQDHSTVTDEFRKHLGEGPGTALELESVQNLMLEMEKMHSACKVEIKGLKNELSFIKSSGEVSSPVLGRQGNEAMLHKLAQSQQDIASLQNEMETLKESKRMSEDQLENLKVVIEDLETQLTVTKTELHELLQKLSCVEVELDDKSHCCQELEGTCLELQLQLESIANNPYAENHENQGGLQQTGMEITAEASAKLAECEETIVMLGKQLKALGSAKELDMSDSRRQNLKQRSSLRDQMMFEDNGQVNNEESPQTKQIISTTVKSVPSACNNNAISFPDGQVATPATYLGIKNESKNMKSGALVIVPSKRKGGGGIGLLRKLLVRRKKSSSKNTSIYFGK